jgi:hypothetical protein
MRPSGGELVHCEEMMEGGSEGALPPYIQVRTAGDTGICPKPMGATQAEVVAERLAGVRP